MFDAVSVNNALLGRLGFRSSVILTDGSVFTAQESRSGRYFEDFHRATTLQNIYDTMEQVNASASGFEDYLKGLQTSAILNSLNAVFNEDTLIEQSLVFNRKNEKIIRNSKVADGYIRGYKINVAQEPTYCSVIRNLSLLFAKDGELTIKVVHSNAGEIASIDVQITANVEKVVPVNIPLYYTTDQYKGGFFYLYYISDIEPIEYSSPDFNKTLLYCAAPFEGTDIENVSLTSRTYGVNMQICGYRDFTEVILLNDYIFDTLIGLQMTATVIEQVLNSTRSNKTQRITNEALKDLYNDLNIMYSTPEFPYSTGIKAQIARELKRVKQNILPKSKNIIATPCFTSRIIR